MMRKQPKSEGHGRGTNVKTQVVHNRSMDCWCYRKLANPTGSFQYTFQEFVHKSLGNSPATSGSLAARCHIGAASTHPANAKRTAVPFPRERGTALSFPEEKGQLCPFLERGSQLCPSLERTVQWFVH